MLSRSLVWLALAFLAPLGAGCAEPGPSQPRSTSGDLDGLHVDATTNQTAIVLVVRNDTGAPLTYSIGCGRHWVFADARGADGTGIYTSRPDRHCLTVPPPQSFEPGATLAATFDAARDQATSGAADAQAIVTWHVDFHFSDGRRAMDIRVPA